MRTGTTTRRIPMWIPTASLPRLSMRANLKALWSAALLIASATSPAADFQRVFRTEVSEPAAATPPAPEQPRSAPATAAQTEAAAAPVNRNAARAARVRPGQQSPAVNADRAVVMRAPPTAQPPMEPAPATAARPGDARLGAAAADIARGEALYQRGEILQAAQIFENRARAEGTPAQQSKTLFRLGVQWQGEALKAPAHQRADVRNAAIS